MAGGSGSVPVNHFSAQKLQGFFALACLHPRSSGEVRLGSDDAATKAQEASSVAPQDAVHLVTYLDLLPAQADTGRALLIGAVKEEKAQQGCISVELVQEQNRANHFMLVETWNDQTALKSDRATKEYLAFRTTLQPALASPFDERRGSQIAP